MVILSSLCRFQIASSLTKELCALVFGINTFLGTILKSIINLIFSDKRGLGLDVHSQVKQSFNTLQDYYCVMKTAGNLPCFPLDVFHAMINFHSATPEIDLKTTYDKGENKLNSPQV